ncbi:dopamine D2-like receptor [Parasteatoda tepidariorum]|uniref:dopamine D2-like receptor n=1 Tax=Parasteatoda tepidariorum TaxID=114398 RepID=UPI00077FCBBC|nr:dopamine D2-like receptor [Parasteatoda tepidariorum]
MNDSRTVENITDLDDYLLNDINLTNYKYPLSTWNDTEVDFNNCSSNNLSSCPWNVTDIDDIRFDIVPPAKVYWTLVMIPLPLVAVVGNILVILSVYKERSLQSATNYFIVSLAFADLLVAAVVMPFAVYVLVNVDWELSETLCDFYIALDVTCSTASIFNLVAISVDRFIAVTQPIKYSKHKNNKRVFLTIIFVWLVSAAIGSPIVLGLNTSPERQPNLCVFYNSDFIIYSSLSSFYIPCLVMVYLYYKIFRAIHERARKAIGNKVPTRSKKQRQDTRTLVIENTPRTGNSGINRQNQGVSYIKTLSPLIEGDEVSQICPSENVDEDDDDEESPTTVDKDCQIISNVGNVSNNETFSVVDHESVSLSEVRSTSKKAPTFKVNGSAVGDTDLGVNAVAKKNKKKNPFKIVKPEKGKKKREKNAARRERKATKTLAIVLGVFLMCWVPFFTCNILDAICIKLQNDTWRPGVTVFLLTTWLGYINSCVNPVIYTIFNLEFRKAFTKLLLEPCK